MGTLPAFYYSLPAFYHCTLNFPSDMLRTPFSAFYLSLFLGAGLANAQVAPTAKKPPVAPVTKPAPATSVEDRVTALTNNMVQALGLTPAQAEKVRVINTNSVRNVEAARQRYSTNPTKLRGSIEDIGLARLEQLKDVLTPAQFGRYQQKREEKLGIPTVRGYQGTPPPTLGSNGRGGDE
jgi:hypothetical protein